MSLFDSMPVQRLLMALPLILPLAACTQEESEAAPGSQELAAADAPQVEVVAKEA